MSSSNRSAVVVDAERYSLDGILPIEGFDEVAAGTRLLVSGPPLSGKRALAHRLVAHGAPTQPSIVVSTDRPAQQVVTHYEDTSSLSIVDCTGTATAPGTPVEYVSAPDDLTGVGIAIAKRTQAIGDRARHGVRIGIDSLSSFLRYVDEGRVFYFLQILTGRFTAAGYLTVCTIDADGHSDRMKNSVQSLFDGMVELREADDGTSQVRAVGFGDEARRWVPIER